MVRWLSSTDTVKDMLVHLGTGQNDTPILTVRLVQVRFERQWYSYVTSVLDAEILPPFVVADLYRRRWRIEDAFNILKRVLNLGYLWTGSVNGIKLQLWATWLFYAVLLDLGDAVADALKVPMERISLEMLFRGIYHFSQAYAKGLASDLVAYFASPQNQDLGVVKTIRKPILKLHQSPVSTLRIFLFRKPRPDATPPLLRGEGAGGEVSDSYRSTGPHVLSGCVQAWPYI